MVGPMASNPQKIQVQFDSSVAGKPLEETVWDNVSGAFWDVKESKQIGFTQDYEKFIPVVIAGGAMGGAVGGFIAGTSGGPELMDTRIVIPFGRVFEGVFQSGLKQTFPNSMTIPDPVAPVDFGTGHATPLVKLKVTEFYVWEHPLNHLNLKATVQLRVYGSEMLAEPIYVYEACGLVTNQPMGTVMSTSSGFIKEMNKISNRFAADLSGDLLEKLQKKFAH